MGITIEVAPGELIDKVTILEIKLEEIADPLQLRNVRYEYELLSHVLDTSIEPIPQTDELRAELKAVNKRLWDIEDDIRDCERRKDFGPRFVDLARSVYRTNDLRAAIKKRINELQNSAIVEEKSYTHY